MHYFQEGCENCHYDHCDWEQCRYSFEKGYGFIIGDAKYC